MGGVGNTVWTVSRGQQSTTAALAAAGATVAPTGANLYGSIITAVAANAHTTSDSGVANDVTSVILNTPRCRAREKPCSQRWPIPHSPAHRTWSRPSFPTSSSPSNCSTKWPSSLHTYVKLVSTDLRWLLTYAAVYGGLDFAQLPVTPAQPALNLLPMLNTLLTIKLVRLSNAATPSSSVQTLYNMIAGVGTGIAANGGSDANGPRNHHRLACGRHRLVQPPRWASLMNCTQPAAYDALRALEAMTAAAGSSAAQMVSWGAIPPDEPTAKALPRVLSACSKRSNPPTMPGSPSRPT